MSLGRRAVIGGLLASPPLLMTGFRAKAATLKKVKVGKSILTSFPFAGLELGQQKGIWEAVGLDVEVVTLPGDGKMQQGFAAGVLDFGLGSGPGMGYTVKGVPARAVAVMAYAPNNIALVVGPKSGIKTIDELKGQTVGVTTAGSLTDWCARKIADMKHWQPDDITIVPMGDARTRWAALATGQIAGSVHSIQEAYAGQERGGGTVLLTFSAIVPHFFTHVIFASDDMIKNHPEIVAAFVKGWFTVAAYMRDHRGESVQSIAKTMQNSVKIVDETYPLELGMMSFDGHFDGEGMDVLRQSLKDLHILDSVPDAAQLYSDKFVPVLIK